LRQKKLSLHCSHPFKKTVFGKYKKAGAGQLAPNCELNLALCWADCRTNWVDRKEAMNKGVRAFLNHSAVSGLRSERRKSISAPVIRFTAKLVYHWAFSSNDFLLLCLRPPTGDVFRRFDGLLLPLLDRPPPLGLGDLVVCLLGAGVFFLFRTFPL
jgi:hypothetical protein